MAFDKLLSSSPIIANNCKDKRNCKYNPSLSTTRTRSNMTPHFFPWCLFAAAVVISSQSVAAFSPSRALQIRGSSNLQRSQISTLQSSTSPTALLSANADDDICRVQILMSDTGGGHRASANALRDAFDTLYPGQFECDIVDIYTDYGPFFPYNAYVEGYKIMAKYPILWDIFYQFGETDFGLWLNEAMLTTFCFEPFKECINRPSGTSSNRADMVVSVHPLCQDLPLQILADLDSSGETRDPTKRTTPFVTVVTDLGGAHKTWFNKFVDKCFVPSDVLNEKAQSRGLDSSQIVQYGLPIRKGFWSEDISNSSSEESSSLKIERRKGLMSKILRRGHKQDTTTAQDQKDAPASSSTRSHLGIESDLPTVLVVGGGDGMGGIVDIAKELGKKLESGSSSPAYQMVVVCGNNADAQKELTAVEWGSGVRVHVKGFVNNMDEWMRASDALVTKAGPGTIAEASICGLPCMLFAYLPGQEEGNVPFVENSGFGRYSGNPSEIADTVSSWLASPEKMDSMKAAALKAARPSATLDIASDLAEIAFAKKLTREKVLVRSR